MKNIKSRNQFLNESIMNIIELANLTNRMGLYNDVVLKMQTKR